MAFKCDCSEDSIGKLASSWGWEGGWYEQHYVTRFLLLHRANKMPSFVADVSDLAHCILMGLGHSPPEQPLPTWEVFCLILLHCQSIPAPQHSFLSHPALLFLVRFVSSDSINHDQAWFASTGASTVPGEMSACGTLEAHEDFLLKPRRRTYIRCTNPDTNALLTAYEMFHFANKKMSKINKLNIHGTRVHRHVGTGAHGDLNRVWSLSGPISSDYFPNPHLRKDTSFRQTGRCWPCIIHVVRASIFLFQQNTHLSFRSHWNNQTVAGKQGVFQTEPFNFP